MNALVLDCEQESRVQVRCVLEGLGLRVLVANDAAKARRMIDQTPMALVVVDGEAGGAGGGLALAEWVQARADTPAVIVLADRGPPEYAERARAAGAVACLERPVDPDLLAHCAQHALAARSLSAGTGVTGHDAAETASGETHAGPALGLPIVWLSERGEIVRANPAGERVLDTVVDPSLARPLTVVDADLLTRLRAGQLDPGGQTIVFRRDGELGHHLAYVRQGAEAGEDILMVSFVEAGAAPSGEVDDLWMPILRRAARGAAREDRPKPPPPGQA